jgi:hypothetical protein
VQPADSQHAAKLIAELRRLSAMAADPPDIDGYEPTSADYLLPRLHRVSIEPSELTWLVALRETSWLHEYEGGTANYSPSGQASISLDAIANWLVAQARTRSPEDCLELLHRSLTENNSSLLEIVPIWGISPIRPIELDDGIKIVPIETLPPSRLKDLFTGTKRHRFSFDVASSSPRPGAAVVKETLHGPLYEPASSQSAVKSRRQGELMLRVLMAPTQEEREGAMREIAETMDPLKAARESSSIYSVAEELIRVVALLCPRPLFALGQWYQRPSELPIVGQLGGYSGPTNDHPFYTSVDKQDYPVDDIQALINAYRSLPAATRNRLKTPLARLNQGRRQLAHHTIEAAAVDLGIAAEALLTQDRDHDAPISYLVRTRGTLLLGGSADERRDHYRQLRDLYNLRSTVAHQGEIVDRTSSPHSASARERLKQAAEVLRHGESLCIRMMRRIIASGSFPIWDDLALGL